MSNAKTVMSQAANTWAGPTYIEDVFSTYLYTGTNATQSIVNGVDLAGEGGLVWTKNRDGLATELDHQLMDSEQGAFRYVLESSNTNAAFDYGASIITPQADGFDLSSASRVNQSGKTYVSWTWRKAPRFFDVVTWTGDGTSGRTINHNLGTDVGFVTAKITSATSGWLTHHKDLGFAIGDGLSLNGTDATGSYYSPITASSDTTITILDSWNTSGQSYVAYLFAHDPLGPSGDGSDGLIACGSFTTNADGSLDLVDLGWEPQWLLIKNTGTTGNWEMHDAMRDGTLSTRLRANLSDAEVSYPSQYLKAEATGFSAVAGWGGISVSKVYIAIRRGPMRQPESGTEVFAVDLSGSTAPRFESSFPVDMAFWRPTLSSNTKIASRLTGKQSLLTNDTSSEDSANANVWDFMDGFYDGGITSNYAWMFRRAPGFMDVVAYSGTGTERGVPHNLGVTPEMLIIKARDFAGKEWFVHHTGLTSWAKVLQLQSTATETNGDTGGNLPTETTFPVNASSNVNATGYNYIAYLFATLPGVSKVGSVSHTQYTDTNVDCGFSSGARFILIKRSSGTGSWYVFDTERGIVAGDDKAIYLQTTLAEQTADWIDPLSSGFTMVGGSFDTGTYIYLAIA